MENKSEEKLKQITDLLWKIWWFSLYLLIIPSIALLVSYLLTFYIVQDYMFSVFLSIIFFLFCQLFFYQIYDKYRENPFFKTHSNNPKSWINITFLIPLFSLGVAIIPVILKPFDENYQILPFLYYTIICLNLFFYIRSKPIEGYDLENKKFISRIVKDRPFKVPKIKYCANCGELVKADHYFCPSCGNKIERKELAAKQREEVARTRESKYRWIDLKKPHNFILFITYLTNSLFLLFTVNLSYYSVLILILVYICSYFYALTKTKNQRNYFEQDKLEEDVLTKTISTYKKNSIISFETLLFCLIFFITVIHTFLMVRNMTDPLLNVSIVILSITFSLILFFSYLKVRIVSVLYYSEEFKSKEIKYKKYNGFFSTVIYSLLFILIFLIQEILINILGVLAIAVLFCVSYYEQKENYISRAFISFLYLTLTCVIIGLISFSVIPLFWRAFTLNFQIITFLICFYFSLEIFKYFKLFTVEKIIISQNFISVVLFFLISFSIYPFLITEGNIILNTYIGILIFFISLLLSFYRLYHKFFKESFKELFGRVVIVNFALIDLLIVLIIDYFLGLYSITPSHFVLTILLSGGLFLIFLTGFIELNYRFEIIDNAHQHYYYIIWAGIPLVFTLILYLSFFLTLALSLSIFGLYLFLCALLGDIIFLCFLLQYQYKFGVKLEKLQLKRYTKVSNVNAFLTSFGLAGIVFLLTSLIPTLDYIIIIFLSLLTLTLSLNLSAISELVSAEKTRLILNSLFLLYLSFIVLYYMFLSTQESFYFIHLPSIFFCLLLNFLLLYLRAKQIAKKVIKIVLWANNLVLCVLLVSIPFIFALDLFYSGFSVDILTTINTSLSILFLEVLIIYYIVKKIQPESKYLTNLLRVEVVIAIILTGTMIFYYPFLFISGLFLGLLIPFILSSCFFYIPLAFSRKKQLFNVKAIDILILLNTLFLGACIVVIPAMISFEILKLGLRVSFLYPIIATLVILFLFGKIIISLANKITISTLLHSFLHIALILNWILISAFVAYTIFDEISALISISSDLINWYPFLIPFSLFLFFSLHTYNIILLQNLRDYFKDITQQDTLSLKIDKILTYCKYGAFYGIVGSLSFVFTFATVYFDILVFLPKGLMILNYILFIILFWSLLNPIFFNIFPNFDSPNVLRKNINRISLSLAFSISFMVFIQSFWSTYLHAMISLTYSIPFFLFSLFLIGLFGYQKFKMMEEENELIKQFYLAFMELIILFLSILWLEPILMIPFLLILNILLSFKRPGKLSIRWVQYSILSTLGLIRFLIWFEQLNILSLIMGLHYGINIILYLMNLILVLAFSILLNLHYKNFNEKVSLYLAFSALTFTFLMSFTTILLIYGITISLFIFLVSFGIDLYIAGDNNYKLFIKPCIVIFVFNMISWISYTFLFTKPALMLYNTILTFSLTATVTSLTFIILYKDLVEPLRKIFIGFSCLSITIFIPTFIYVLFISYLQINFSNPILIIISLNLAFALFYVSLSIYYWEISWKIWRVGWYLWLIIPIANFYLINKLILGVDVYTNAISFLGTFDLTGSFIITLILSTLFYIPVFYSKLKKYFYEIIIIIWAESLSLTYWISQNLFSNSLILSNLFFGLLSVLIIIPILWKMKMWWIISPLWFLLAALNCGFLSYFLYSLNFLIELIISIDIIIVSIFSLLFSMFPNIRGRKSRILLIFSYFLTLLGVFLLIFFILFNILMHPIISMNLAFIIISGALFTSKYIKLNQIYTRFAISLVFTANISSIVFFTFNMIPNLIFFSFFFALATFFGSLLLVNHFDMIIRRVNYKFFWIPFGFNLSLSFVLFLFLFIPSHIYLLSGLFILINVLFIHRVLNRFISVITLLYPVAFALFLLEVIILIEFLRNYLILVALLLYISIYQTLLNVLRYRIEMSGININPFYKALFKDPRKVVFINIGCFSLNSLIFSLLLSVVSLSIMLYQLILFFMTLSILSVFNLYYVRINNKHLHFNYTALLLNLGGAIFYTIIPLLSALSSVLILFSNTINIIYVVITFLFTLSCVLFVEILVDKLVFNLLLLNKEGVYSHTKILHSLGYLIYLQCDLIFFLFIINFIGIFESLIAFMAVLIPLLLGDIYGLDLLAKKASYLALTILSLCLSVLSLLVLINYSYPEILFIKLDTMLFISSLFITNYLYFKARENIFTEKALKTREIKEKGAPHNRYYSIRKNILGILFYISFIIFIQDAVSLVVPIDDLVPHIFLINSFIFILSGVDKKIFRFLEGSSKYFLSGSWILLIITSNVFLIDLWVSFIPEFLITVVPTIIFVSSLQLIYLCKILSFWTYIKLNESRIQNILIGIIFLDIISLPLYFLTLKFIFIDFNLIFLSIVLMAILLKLEDLFRFTDINESILLKMLYYTVFIIIFMLSIDIFIIFECLIRSFLPLFSLTLNLNLSLLILMGLYALFFKTFGRHSRTAVISWILIFITFSCLIFQITFYFDFLPFFFTLSLFSIALILYPFIFLMEKVRQLFQLIINKVLGFFNKIYHKFTSFFTILKQYLISLRKILKSFIKKYWVYQLAIVCGVLGITLTLIFIFSLNFPWFNSVLIGGGLACFIMFLAYSYKKSIEDPNVALKYRMFYLSSIWSAILGIVFNFLFIRFYLIAFFLSLVILGAILLPYIYYKERKEGISIKWRFYFTLIFILIVVLTLILFYFQIIIEIF